MVRILSGAGDAGSAEAILELDQTATYPGFNGPERLPLVGGAEDGVEPVVQEGGDIEVRRESPGSVNEAG